MVVNGFNNVGLFKGMDAASMPGSGPVAYTDVATMIHAELGTEGNGHEKHISLQSNHSAVGCRT